MLCIDNLIKLREEAASAFAGLHECPLSWSNWKLEMLVFVEGGEVEHPEKNPQSKERTDNKLNPYTCMTPGQNGTWLHWWKASGITTRPSLLLKHYRLLKRDQLLF